jgi:hypothetical protein
MVIILWLNQEGLHQEKVDIGKRSMCDLQNTIFFAENIHIYMIASLCERAPFWYCGADLLQSNNQMGWMTMIAACQTKRI